MCLTGHFGQSRLAAQPSQPQADVVRRQYLQALQRGDLAGAERFQKELRALEDKTASGTGLVPPREPLI